MFTLLFSVILISKSGDSNYGKKQSIHGFDCKYTAVHVCRLQDYIKQINILFFLPTGIPSKVLNIKKVTFLYSRKIRDEIGAIFPILALLCACGVSRWIGEKVRKEFTPFF